MFASYDSGLDKANFGTLGIYCFRLMTVDSIKRILGHSVYTVFVL